MHLYTSVHMVACVNEEQEITDDKERVKLRLGFVFFLAPSDLTGSFLGLTKRSFQFNSRRLCTRWHVVDFNKDTPALN